MGDGQMRVLVAEDHATLAGRIAQGLSQAGMAVDAVHDGAAALDAAVLMGLPQMRGRGGRDLRGIGIERWSSHPACSGTIAPCMASSPQKSRTSGSAVISCKKPMDGTVFLTVILCAVLNLPF
jgi:hypothetical protein